MPNDSSGIDPKKIWQGQPTETSAMTLEKIRNKMRELHGKRRRNVLGTVAGPLAAIFSYVLCAKEFPALQHVLQPLLVLALIWSVAGVIFLNRGMWPAAMPGDTGLSTGLEFCREEIERRRTFLGRVLVWSFGPALLCIGTIVLALVMAGARGHGIIPNGLPFLTLVAVWIVAYFVIRLREHRELDRHADELNAIERENRG